MVSPPRATDPASCSQLGGSLRRIAGQLLSGAAELAVADPTTTIIQEVAARLDAAGAALQSHAQEMAELAVAGDRLAQRVQQAGLELLGWRVVEPFGIASVDDAARRQAAMTGLQTQSDALAARTARVRGALERSLGEAQRGLAAAVATARR